MAEPQPAAVSQLLSVINPSGDITHVLAGYTPVPATPHSLSQKRVFLHVPYVVQLISACWKDSCAIFRKSNTIPYSEYIRIPKEPQCAQEHVRVRCSYSGGIQQRDEALLCSVRTATLILGAVPSPVWSVVN